MTLYPESPLAGAFADVRAGLYLPDMGLTRGLIGHWFSRQANYLRDDAMVPTIYGTSPLTGPLGSANRWVDSPGIRGTALSFDGTSASDITLTARQFIADASDFSWTCWVNGQATSSNQSFFRFGDSVSSPYLTISGHIGTGNGISWYTCFGGAYYSGFCDNPPSAITSGVWYHCGYSAPGASGNKQYTWYASNGIPGKFTDAGNTPANFSNTTAGFVNSIGTNVFAERLSAKSMIYSLRLYNRQLLEGEFRAIYEFEKVAIENNFDSAVYRSFVNISAPGAATWPGGFINAGYY